MKLKAFRINNYRSIIDTNWNQLASDNITGLIGQNESGKTSVLEALMSFYDGKIIDDILRSDLAIPQVSCKFEIEKGFLTKILDKAKLQEGLDEIIKDLEQIEITRRWNEDKSSKIFISEPSIKDFYDNINQSRSEEEQELRNEMEETLNNNDKAENQYVTLSNEVDLLQQEHDEWKAKIPALQKTFDKTKKQHIKEETGKELQQAKNQVVELVEIINEKNKVLAELKKTRNQLSDKAHAASFVTAADEKLTQARENLDKAYDELKDVEYLFDIAVDETEKRAVSLRLDEAKRTYINANQSYQEAINDLIEKRTIAKYVFKGKSLETARKNAFAELEQRESFYNLESIATEVFREIPTFEFFEDFSSLLPNKIDLEDVLSENTAVEGYKAAKNFLMIAGLDAKFFEQKNNRILKQKIEKLNGDITINFQDYWRQRVGKNNKINLNFDLEHYDFTHPEKSGKPYIEFWIKDKNERLYPKQRSRGVRWFLSFYLELKASAAENNKKRVLLIDEPGLSLHARAQEDVLKVFEDLKENMQIIYSTHSPHLIDSNKIYRLLAVQRADVDDMYSETLLFDAKTLNQASTDTLSPIYSLMGTRLNDQQYIQAKNNILVEDISTYYYYSTYFKIFGVNGDVYFLPATDVKNVTTLANLLLGWKIHFIVVLDDDVYGREVYDDFKQNMFFNDEAASKKRMVKLDGIKGAEDVLSTIDFKKYVLNKRVGITESNSEFVDTNNLSRSILASNFSRLVEDKKLTLNDFDDETQENITNLVSRIKSLTI